MAYPHQEFDFAPYAPHKVLFRQTRSDTNGRMLQMEVHISPETGGHPMHFHPVQEESIEVIKGRLSCIIEGKKYILHPGEHLIIYPGEAHTYCNETSEQVYFINEMRPALDYEYFIEELQECLRKNKVRRLHSLSGLLHFMVIFNRYKKEMMLAGHPSKILGSILVRLGSWLGYGQCPR